MLALKSTSSLKTVDSCIQFFSKFPFPKSTPKSLLDACASKLLLRLFQHDNSESSILSFIDYLEHHAFCGMKTYGTLIKEFTKQGEKDPALQGE